MKNNLFYAALATMMLAACSNEEVIDTTLATPVELQVSAGVNSETRTNGETWEDGDKIGISVTSSTKSNGSTMTDYTNVEYDLSEGANTTTASFAAPENGTKILFSDATESVNFAAYSPYSSGVSDASISLSAAGDGSITDYLWAEAKGKTYTDNPVSFQFSHKMAKLKIEIKLNSDFDSSTTIGDATITGLYSSASFDIKTGTVSGQSTGSDVTFTSGTFDKIIIPGSPSLTLSVTIGDQKYNVSAFTPTVTQGKSYQYTITAGKTGLTVSSCTINSWPTSTTGTGSASMTSK